MLCQQSQTHNEAVVRWQQWHATNKLCKMVILQLVLESITSILLQTVSSVCHTTQHTLSNKRNVVTFSLRIALNLCISSTVSWRWTFGGRPLSCISKLFHSMNNLVHNSSPQTPSNSNTGISGKPRMLVSLSWTQVNITWKSKVRNETKSETTGQDML